MDESVGVVTDVDITLGDMDESVGVVTDVDVTLGDNSESASSEVVHVTTSCQTDMLSAHIEELDAALIGAKKDVDAGNAKVRELEDRIRISHKEMLMNDPHLLKFYTGAHYFVNGMDL